jgi:hypothetical protein
VFVSIKGGSYSNFQRALAAGNLLLIRAAAAELPTVNLQDALDICIVVAENEPELFERAALRWLARYCLERRDANLAGLRQAADAFARLESEERPCGYPALDPSRVWLPRPSGSAARHPLP